MKQEVDIIKRMLRKIIKSMPDTVEEDRDVFRRGNKKIRLSVKKNEVKVEPIGYYYESAEQVKEEEFELKDAIETYIKYRDKIPRLTFEERSENRQQKLYCMIEAKGVRIEFMPKWIELLNGVNRMVHTEYKNAKKRKKDEMYSILKSLSRITKRAENYCRKLGYDI